MKTLNITFEEKEIKLLEKRKKKLAEKVGLPNMSWKIFIMLRAGLKLVNMEWVDK